NARFVGTVQKTEIIPDVVGELGLQAGTENLETLPWFGVLLTLNQDGGAGITKDEVAVPVPEVQVARTDFRTDHQHRTSGAVFHRIDRRLQTESRGAARHVHVVG